MDCLDSEMLVNIAVCAERHWIYKTFLEYPDPIHPRRDWEPHRYRAIGIRDDGQIYQLICMIPPLEIERMGKPDVIKRSERYALLELNRYLNVVSDEPPAEPASRS